MVAIRRPKYEALQELGRSFEESPKLTDEELEAIRTFPVINARMDILDDLKFSNRNCESCGFPIKPYQKNCKVCIELETDRKIQIKEIEKERRKVVRLRKKAAKIRPEDRLKKVLRPTWRMRVEPAAEELSRTASKFGGLPYLEGEEEWPACESCQKNMDFICQADVSQTEPGQKLSVGFFTFFLCWDCQEFGLEDNRPENHVRFYPSASESRLSTNPKIESDEPFPERAILLEQTVSAPDCEELVDYARDLDELLELEHPDDALEAYLELVTKVGATCEPCSQVGGYPWWIQGSEIEDDSILLAQIHSSESDGPVFGDGGSIYILIDAVSREVDLSFQCY